MACFPALGQEKPMVITSDTVQYCNELQLRLARTSQAGPEVQALVADGRKLCDHGEVRGGIARLRRALVMQNRQGRAPHR
jgi:hypothetical protein